MLDPKKSQFHRSDLSYTAQNMETLKSKYSKIKFPLTQLTNVSFDLLKNY